MKLLSRFTCFVVAAMLFTGCNVTQEKTPVEPLVEAKIPFSPEKYVCMYAQNPIRIDGIPDDKAWQRASWSCDFVDILGAIKPVPPLRTRMKMLWDDDFLYVAAELEEPHVWATLKERDTVIFYDNDFEIFIDPDGDTHLYYEFEMNALGTYWDLLLSKPYRDGGLPVDAWDISGIKVATYVNGTLNNPGDTDTGWSLEVAMPWKILEECAPGGRLPVAGDIWRINFSRVEWESDVLNGNYVKKISAMTGKPLAEHNWVWSPQGIMNMHAPETWGFLFFTRQNDTAFIPPQDEQIKWLLRNVYYKQSRFFENQGRYAESLQELNVSADSFHRYGTLPLFYTTPSMYEVTFSPEKSEKIFHIRQDGKVWVTEKQ